MLRTTVFIDLPKPIVAAAVTEPGVLAGIRGVSVRATVDGHPSLLPGTVLASHVDWSSVPGRFRSAVLSAAVTAAGDGTMLACSFDCPVRGGRLGEAVAATVLRGRMLGVLDALCTGVRRRSRSLAVLPVVVGTAILADGRVLAQQRGYPAAVAGRWELPGGRVEEGESERQAVLRECAEELGVDVLVRERVGADVAMDGGMLLRVYAAELSDADARPRAREHRAVRWVAAAELDTIDWLDADRVLLPALHVLLES